MDRLLRLESMNMIFHPMSRFIGRVSYHHSSKDWIRVLFILNIMEGKEVYYIMEDMV